MMRVCDLSAASFLTPRPSSLISLGREKLCFDSGHCATGIWEFFFFFFFSGLDWLDSVTALSCCQACAVNERPPPSSLEINFSQGLAGARYEEETVFMVRHVE